MLNSSDERRLAFFLFRIMKLFIMKNTLILLLVLASVLGSCKKEDLDNIDQPVLFQFEYINHAWVHTHQGWMIDDMGNVKGFNLPENWNTPDKDNRMNKAELIENLASADTLYTTLKEPKLMEHFSDRYEMQGAVMDTSDTFMADAGVGALYVYLWDKKDEVYDRVLLASKGDISVTNESAEAKAAVRWLREIGEQTDRFFWFDD